MKLARGVWDNPFRALGASPTDRQARLSDLADEGMLLGTLDSEAPLNALLNSKQRVEAEIRWFPITEADQVRAVIAFMEAESAAAMPAFQTSSALSLFNACLVFADRWPWETGLDAAALVRSLDGVWRRITPQIAMLEINRDRSRAGVQLIVEPDWIRDALDMLLSEATDGLCERLQNLPMQQQQAALEQLESLMADPETAMGLGGRVARRFQSVAMAPLDAAFEKLHAAARLAPATLVVSQRENCLHQVDQAVLAWHGAVRKTGNLPGALAGKRSRLHQDAFRLAFSLLCRVPQTGSNNPWERSVTDAALDLADHMRQIFGDIPGADKALTDQMTILRTARTAQHMQGVRKGLFH